MTGLDAATPEPFEPRPRDAASFAGCSKPLLLGCGALFVLLGIASLAFLLKAKDLFGWAIDKHQTIIFEAMPVDVTAAERERLAAAYAAVIEAVEEGRADPNRLQELQQALSKAAARAENLTRRDVLDLTLALEAVAQVEIPDAAGPPLEASPRSASARGTAVATAAA